jgi:hypothetical protein
MKGGAYYQNGGWVRQLLREIAAGGDLKTNLGFLAGISHEISATCK